MKVDALREAIRLVAAAGHSHVARSASAELLDLIDRPDPDPRRVITLERARQVYELRYVRRLPRAVICERLRISRHQYHHALREARNLKQST
jgi:hypothetical protein